MAPVTRYFIEDYKLLVQKGSCRRVSMEGKKYSPLKLVHCILHLDQVRGLKFPVRKLEKLQQRLVKKSNSRIIYPLTFKPFKSDILEKSSTEGNITFIMGFAQLLRRFPRVYDYGLDKITNGWRQRVLLTRSHRDVSRYTPLVAATPAVAGDIWWQDNMQNNILTQINPSSKEQLQLEVLVDIDLSDFNWLKRNYTREILDHDKCTKFGDLCPNLMERGTAWEACHF